jgi:hypothetical protein
MVPMAVVNCIEYDTCAYCGEPVRRLTVSGVFGRVRSVTTGHVRHVRDPHNRCKYDNGPYAESNPLAPFPGDT